MKTLKLLGKTLFWILILGILLCPVYLIFQLSEAEMAEYKTPPPPVILDSAYGEICQASRGDLEEFVTVSGSYVCRDGQIITGRGAGVAMDFGLAIAAEFVGQEKADAIRASLQCR